MKGKFLIIEGKIPTSYKALQRMNLARNNLVSG